MDQLHDNGYSAGDFKRNAQQDSNEQGGQEVKLNERSNDYLRELLNEKVKLDSDRFPNCVKLLDQEVLRVQTTGRLPSRDNKFVDVYHDKPTKVAVKVVVPVKEHPKFNFVGKLLGPKGFNLKSLQEETMCKMAILGRGSIRDKQKEDELRNGLDPKYMHLSDDLHVEITATGPPGEAHARIAYALAEIRKQLQPDDVPRPLSEMMERRAAPYPLVAPSRGLPQRSGGRPPLLGARSGPPAKAKVMTILDRARSAMETAYGFEDHYEDPAIHSRGRAVEADYYTTYDRSQDRYYDDDSYFKEDAAPREFKATTRVIGTRRAPSSRHFARDSPYSRPPK